MNVENKQKKKDLGAFYTPTHTANYMINMFSSVNGESKILEPCGGDGVFVRNLLNRKKVKPEQIEVWDINPRVERSIRKLGVKFVLKDTLLDTEFKSLFQPKFTHIIGNPPYLNKQSLYIKKNKKKLRKIYKDISVNDTYALFLYLCGNLLEKDGELVFIISDTYRTLKIHKKLRYWLLRNFVIEEITLCPPSLFKSRGVTVQTSIIHLIKREPTREHKIRFNDCRKNKVGDYSGKIWNVNQLDILEYPNYVFYFEDKKNILNLLKSAKIRLTDLLEGGLGMHTTDNKKYLALIKYKNRDTGTNRKIRNIVPAGLVKRGKGWRIYHKTGGNNKYYKRPSYALRWDKKSVKKYKMLKRLKRYEGRQGFIVSGICSSLSARIAYKNALWESNKAMCFFPNNPRKYPVYFFIGILNSKTYDEMIKIINSTNSIQIRDIKLLPMLNFSEKDIKRISRISKFIVDHLKRDSHFDFRGYQREIDKIVLRYVK